MPTLSYNLEKEDYLAFQLYNASISKSIKQNRSKSRLLLVSAFALLGLLMFVRNSNLAAIVFSVGSVITFLLYPKLLRNRYQKIYETHVADTFVPDSEGNGKLELENDRLIGSNSLSETMVKTDLIQRIDETEKYIFVKVTTGIGFIIPKDRVTNLEEANAWLAKQEQKLGITRIVDLDWEWK